MEKLTGVTAVESEWWWIDYLESELDPLLEKDLEMLLAVSEEDRVAFENFRLIRQWVMGSDPAEDFLNLVPGPSTNLAPPVVPLEDRLKRVRKNVMNAIEAEGPEVKKKIATVTKKKDSSKKWEESPTISP